MFNTLNYAKKLEEVGLAREQAEAHVQIMAEVIQTNLATKQDLQDLRVELHNDFIVFRVDMNNRFDSFRADMENRFNAFRSEMENRFDLHEARLTIKLGTIVSVALAIAVAFLKLT